jgi:hypothetical protein
MRKQENTAFLFFLAAVYGLGVTPLFWVGYLCFIESQYWPLLLFAVTIGLAWTASWRAFSEARNICRHRFTK